MTAQRNITAGLVALLTITGTAGTALALDGDTDTSAPAVVQEAPQADVEQIGSAWKSNPTGGSWGPGSARRVGHTWLRVDAVKVNGSTWA